MDRRGFCSRREAHALYKTIRTTVQQGRLYPLTQPLGGDQNNEEGASQVEYVARDDSQAVLLAYLHSMRYQVAILRCGYAAWIRLQCIASTRSMRRSTPASRPSPAPY